MKSTHWIVIGFLAIVVSVIAPAVTFYYSGGDPFSFFGNFLIVAVISQILFGGGIISIIFGFIKFSKE
jgi:hypothetical protein